MNMKKNQYIKPQTTIVSMAFQQHLMAGSNEYQNDAFDLNPENMEGGDGGDAGSRGGYWDDDY